MATVSGFITDANHNGVVRTVRVYSRADGALLGATVSNALNGAYSITTTYTEEVNVVMLDDAVGTVENDQILRTTPV